MFTKIPIVDHGASGSTGSTSGIVEGVQQTYSAMALLQHIIASHNATTLEAVTARRSETGVPEVIIAFDRCQVRVTDGFENLGETQAYAQGVLLGWNAAMILSAEYSEANGATAKKEGDLS